MHAYTLYMDKNNSSLMHSLISISLLLDKYQHRVLGSSASYLYKLRGCLNIYKNKLRDDITTGTRKCSGRWR